MHYLALTKIHRAGGGKLSKRCDEIASFEKEGSYAIMICQRRLHTETRVFLPICVSEQAPVFCANASDFVAVSIVGITEKLP